MAYFKNHSNDCCFMLTFLYGTEKLKCWFFLGGGERRRMDASSSALNTWAKRVGIMMQTYPVGTDQLLNHSLILIFGWEMSWKCNNDQPTINFSISNQPQINQISTWFQPFLNNNISLSGFFFWLVLVMKPKKKKKN